MLAWRKLWTVRSLTLQTTNEPSFESGVSSANNATIRGDNQYICYRCLLSGGQTVCRTDLPASYYKKYSINLFSELAQYNYSSQSDLTQSLSPSDT